MAWDGWGRLSPSQYLRLIELSGLSRARTPKPRAARGSLRKYTLLKDLIDIIDRTNAIDRTDIINRTDNINSTDNIDYINYTNII